MSYKYEIGLNGVTKVFPGGVRAVDGDLGPRDRNTATFPSVFVGPYRTGSGRAHVDWFESS